MYTGCFKYSRVYMLVRLVEVAYINKFGKLDYWSDNINSPPSQYYFQQALHGISILIYSLVMVMGLQHRSLVLSGSSYSTKASQEGTSCNGDHCFSRREEWPKWKFQSIHGIREPKIFIHSWNIPMVLLVTSTHGIHPPKIFIHPWNLPMVL